MKLLIPVMIIIAFLGAIWFFSRPQSAYGRLDEFAKCLSQKGVTMYGADWCSHCQNEKKAFSSSFKYVSYVECPKNPELCLQKGVETYPTWILPNGAKFVGEQGIEKLSEISSCPLKEN